MADTQELDYLYQQVDLLSQLNNDLSLQITQMKQVDPQGQDHLLNQKNQINEILKSLNNDHLSCLINTVIADFMNQNTSYIQALNQVKELQSQLSALDKQKTSIPTQYQALVEENYQLEELLNQANSQIICLEEQISQSAQTAIQNTSFGEATEAQLERHIADNIKLLDQNTLFEAEIFNLKKENSRAKEQLAKLMQFPKKYQEASANLNRMQNQNKIELVKLNSELEKSIEHEQLFSKMLTDSLSQNKQKDSQIKKLSEELRASKRQQQGQIEQQQRDISQMESKLSQSNLFSKGEEQKTAEIGQLNVSGSEQNFALPSMIDSLTLTQNQDPMQLTNEEMVKMYQKRSNALATGATTRALSNARSEKQLLRETQ